jgi:predicted metalloprotease with PDZ domain
MNILYRVAFHPPEHELAVSLTMTGSVAQGEIHLQLPTWVPGDYSFAPQGRDLFNLRARCGETGAELTIRRNGWQGFVVTGGRGHVEVTYTASAWGNDLSESAGLVENSWAIVLGARYLFVPGYTGPCEVHYELPEGWEVHHPSGATRLANATAWIYPDYEILLDTPVVFGHFTRLRREVAGVPIWLVFVDQGVGFPSESARFADQVAAAVSNIRDVFGSFPFDDYTFVLSLNPDNDWGLEHLTSSMCGLGPEVFVNEDTFREGVRVCAHEFFHAWNVRRCRPSPLGNVSQKLVEGAFTDGLWIAEGFTRYYEFLSCARAGVYTAGEFFSNVVGYHNHLTMQPAYWRESAADASYASFLNHAKYPGRVNNAIDYYDKGFLVAVGLDTTLRTERPGASLDGCFADFYRTFEGFGCGERGYTTTDVLEFFGKVYEPLRDQITQAALHPGGLQTARHLQALGFEVTVSTPNALGLVFQDAIGPNIYGVLDDSPAGRAGLAPGDAITGINGFAFSVAALSWVAGRSDEVTLSVQRGHRQLEFRMAPAPREQITSLRWAGTGQQLSLLTGWLGQEIEWVEGHAIDLGFYANFHGIEVTA